MICVHERLESLVEAILKLELLNNLLWDICHIKEYGNQIRLLAIIVIVVIIILDQLVPVRYVATYVLEIT